MVDSMLMLHAKVSKGAFLVSVTSQRHPFSVQLTFRFIGCTLGFYGH